jgi:hypothetical protein
MGKLLGKTIKWGAGLLVGFIVLMMVVIQAAIYFSDEPPTKLEPVAPPTPAQIRSGQIQAALSKAYIPVQAQIQAMMHDPDSFEVVNTTYADRGEYLVMTVTFRGKNQLGAKVLNSMDARVSLNGDVWTVGKIE